MTIRDIHKDKAIRQWLRETDRALAGLQDWRERLTAWGNGAPAGRPDLELALSHLDAAGLADWYEWLSAAGGIDALAEALSVEE